MSNVRPAKRAAAERPATQQGATPPASGRPDDVLDVDVEKHLRWLETGEGEPWPRASRS